MKTKIDVLVRLGNLNLKRKPKALFENVFKKPITGEVTEDMLKDDYAAYAVRVLLEDLIQVDAAIEDIHRTYFVKIPEYSNPIIRVAYAVELTALERRKEKLEKQIGGYIGKNRDVLIRAFFGSQIVLSYKDSSLSVRDLTLEEHKSAS